jgi:hypothetical protein
MRIVLLIGFSWLLTGETLEEAARTMARAAALHLSGSERAHVTLHNLTSLGNSEAARVQASFERGLRRNARNTVVEVTLTISENVKGYLLVAEIGGAVEMISVRRTPAATAAPPGITISKKLLWEQAAPILDVAMGGHAMFVLDTLGVARYERRERQGVMEAPSNGRDPRGRLELEGESVTVHLPGVTCRGTWNPPAALHCEAGGVLTAGRNTLQSDAWPAHFSYARANGGQLLAETDGRTHVYDSSGKSIAAFPGWGSDFAAVEGGCAAHRILASSTSDSTDSIALYDVVNNAPSRLSDPVEFSGPVTALWPAKDGAVAVVRNLVTGRYEAYFVAVDCGR